MTGLRARVVRPRLTLCVLVAIFATQCRTTTSETNAADDPALLTAVWQEAVPVAGQVTHCADSTFASPASPDALCLFADTKKAMIWTSPVKKNGQPLELTLKKAAAYCKALKFPKKSKLNGAAWRLPSRPEFRDAAIDETGQPRAASIVALSDRFPAFGKLEKGQNLWTETSETDSTVRVWAAQRFGTQIIFALTPVETKLAFRCVQGGVNLSQVDLRALEAPSAPPTEVSPPQEAIGKQTKTLEVTGPQDRNTYVKTYTPPAFSDSELSKRPTPPAESPLRERIVGFLQRAFQAKGLDPKLLLQNGDILISNYTGFNFDEVSNRVTGDRAAALRTVLQEYVKVLRAASTIENVKIRFETIGHASPSYGGHPEVGSGLEDPGGRFNLVVGMRRAEAMAELMRDTTDIGPFKITAITMGTEAGVIDPHGPNDKCGDFDCVASRRVVIRFHVTE